VLKRISVSELRLGMYIDELCGSWMEHPFWRTRFALSDLSDARRIVDSGIREVWIDTERGVDIEESSGQIATRAQAEAEIERKLQAAAAASQGTEAAELAEELERAKTVYSRARPAVLRMFNDARMGLAIGEGQAADMVDDIQRSVKRNSGALISLSRLKRADDYTYMH
jgi:hypothetical protein